MLGKVTKFYGSTECIPNGIYKEDNLWQAESVPPFPCPHVEQSSGVKYHRYLSFHARRKNHQMRSSFYKGGQRLYL